MPSAAPLTIPILILSGSDQDAVKKEAKAWTEKLMPADPMNFEVIEGRSDSVDDAVRSIHRVREAIATLPFFGGGKLVWWRGVNFLDDSGAGRFSSVKEALEQLAGDLKIVDGVSVSMVVSAQGMHRGRAFTKELLKRAKTLSFELPDLAKVGEDEIIRLIEGRMRSVGLDPQDGAAERFFQATGTDTSAWSQEIEKLRLYRGAGRSGDQPGQAKVTLEDVNDVISGTREILVWDFCHAVIAGEAPQALSLLQSLLAKEESEVGLLLILAGQVRLAALAAALREHHLLKVVRRGSFSSCDVSPGAEIYLPKTKKGDSISTYALGQAAQRGSAKSARIWVQALDKLFQRQQQMITGQGDKMRLLELVVLEIVAA